MSANNSVSLPCFTLPHEWKLKHLPRYGKNEKDRCLLSKALVPFDHFSITNKTAEDHVAEVRRAFEDIRDPNGKTTILHTFAAKWATYGYPRWDVKFTLLEQILSLGVDPNPLNANNRNPSHVCSARDNYNAAEKLALCRPDLVAVDKLQRMNALGMAERIYNERVAQVWRKHVEHGFPTIAQLACEKKWYAVKNLCRRRAFLEEEKEAKFGGKTAVEWAVTYKQDMLAAELRYLLKGETTGEASSAALPTAPKPAKAVAPTRPHTFGEPSPQEVAARLTRENRKLTMKLAEAQLLLNKKDEWKTERDGLVAQVRCLEGQLDDLQSAVSSEVSAATSAAVARAFNTAKKPRLDSRW